jgi:enoyl-CoA hydratase
VAILTAAGDRAFMAGIDLRDPDGGFDAAMAAPELAIEPARAARDAMWSITDCAVPVIAAVNGAAIGAGLAFAVCCDIILAAEGAMFGTTEINVGLLGASAHLSRLVGRHKARELYFTGELVPAEELQRLGALRAVVPRAALLDEARSLAAQLASKSPIAMRLAKQAMNRVEDLPLKEAYQTEQSYTALLRGFEDSAEAQAAYREKRAPEWRWR